MRTPEYWREYRRAWRRTHRATENARKARNRAIPGWRAQHEPDRHRVQDEPIPVLHLGHQLFSIARCYVRPQTMTVYYDPLPDDLMSEAVLALLEDRDPAEAVKRYRRIEGTWRHVTCPLAIER